MEKKGVQIITFDNNGDLYFLILRRVEGWHGWEFPKLLINSSESEEKAVESLVREQVGISKFKIIKKLNSSQVFEDNGESHTFSFYLVNASMNIPVKNYAANKKHDNYLWATRDSVESKLTWAPEKVALKEAISEIALLDDD